MGHGGGALPREAPNGSMQPAQEAAGAATASCCILDSRPQAASFECRSAGLCSLKCWFANIPRADVCFPCPAMLELSPECNQAVISPI